MPSMTVSLPGLFKNVTRAIKEGDRAAADMYGFSLEEVERHLRETIRGEHTLQEFAEFYCLTEPAALSTDDRA